MAVGRRGGGRARPIRALLTLGSVGDLTDGQLLERFACGPGEASELAFAVLAERHGMMVRRACVAVLRDEHDAQDASQATFLVLARKAGTLRVRGSLGPWLHRVAWRTASGLRATAARRRRHESRLAGRDAEPAVEPLGPPDLDRDAAIHEELARLPERYRAPLILCDLEGRTHAEAARTLGWPVGTVKSRQARGRALIRDRLARRGVGLAVAAAAVGSLGGPAGAMPPSIGLATGLGASPHAVSLARGVLRTMFWIKVRSLVAATVLVGLAAGGAGSYVRGNQEGAGDGPPPSTSAPAPPRDVSPSPDDIKRQRLAVRRAEARYEIARQSRVLAEIALEEAGVGLDPSTVEGEIKLAESDVARTEDRLKWAERMVEKGYLPASQKVAEALNLEKARFGLDRARKRKILADFGDEKLTALRGDLEKAAVEERTRRSTLDREKAWEAELERRTIRVR